MGERGGSRRSVLPGRTRVIHVIRRRSTGMGGQSLGRAFQGPPALAAVGLFCIRPSAFMIADKSQTRLRRARNANLNLFQPSDGFIETDIRTFTHQSQPRPSVCTPHRSRITRSYLQTPATPATYSGTLTSSHYAAAI